MSYNIKSIKEEFKNKGIFYTPPELAKMLLDYVDFEYSNAYDPTCGDGGLLATLDINIKKYGQEINREQLEVAIHRVPNFTGVCGDTLENPAFIEKKFDLILANPPFSIKWYPHIDERFKDAPTIPTASKADYAFILHILHYLSDKGKAIVLEFPGILYRGNREGQIRKWIVEQNYIERVARIPGNTFVDTTIETCLLVLNKHKTTTDIIFEDKEIGEEKSISFEEVKKNDFNLSVNHYVYKEVEKEKIDPVELNDLAMKGVLHQIESQIKFQKSVDMIEGTKSTIYLISEILNLLERYTKGFKDEDFS